MPNLSRGIMLEGTSCAGKTSTMYAIKRLFASDLRLECNIVMLGEHYTQVLNNINGELKNHEQKEHVEMLYHRAEMIEKLSEWACSLGDFRKTSRGLYTVFERGLINHVAHYQDSSDPQIVELGERFTKLGMEAILLIVSDEKMEQRIKLRENQLNHVNTESQQRELLEQFKEQQNKMIASAETMNMPFRLLCTDSMDWDRYAKEIVNVAAPTA